MADFPDWDSCLWEPGGRVLRNLYGERDGAVLAQREYAETNKQQVKIERGAVQIPRTYDAEHVKALHKRLFANVYEWAGDYRTVGMTKDEPPYVSFASPGEIPDRLADAARTIRDVDWPALDRDQFAAAAASTFSYLNYAHGFREGNGRATKLFMQHVSELSRFRLDYRPETSGVSARVWNNASQMSMPDRGSSRPVPDSLVPVFKALAVERESGLPAASLDSVRARSREVPGIYRRHRGRGSNGGAGMDRGIGRGD